MEHFITSTQLKQELRAVKGYASQGVVHVLEHGRASYVLCSSAIYEARLEEARAWGAWSASVEDCLERSRRDVEASRTSPVSVAFGWDDHPCTGTYVTYSTWQDIRSLTEESQGALAPDNLIDVCTSPMRDVYVEFSSASPQDDVLGAVFKRPARGYDVLCTVDVAGKPLLMCGIVQSYSLPTDAPDLRRVFGAGES